MTDEEREEAERLAKAEFPYADHSGIAARAGYLKGYSAASEAKRAEIEPWDKLMRETHWELEDERARSARLLESMRLIRDEDTFDKGVARVAIAEYEGK